MEFGSINHQIKIKVKELPQSKIFKLIILKLVIQKIVFLKKKYLKKINSSCKKVKLLKYFNVKRKKFRNEKKEICSNEQLKKI